MKAAFEKWLKSDAIPAGALAAGVCFHDKTSIIQTFSEPFSSKAVEAFLRSMFEVVHSISGQRLPVNRIRWVFDKAVVCWCARTDGTCLVLFASPDTVVLDSGAVDRWQQDFENLNG